ncbi:MAG: sigma-70 family RNA polymerase sigma factor [Firmicutes bacterium]|nr:sigma-70 family RNA polymerase sigma factor [Bacillota bacterium]
MQTTYTITTLYNLLMPEIKKIHHEYRFLNKTNEELELISLELLKSVINDISNFPKDNVKEYLTKKLRYAWKHYVLSLWEDPKISYEIAQKIIENNPKEINNYDEAVKSYKKIVNFLEKISFILYPEVCKDLIKNTPLFKTLLSIIVKENITTIKNGKLYLVIDSNIGQSFIEGYCMLEGIEIAIDDEIEIDNNTNLDSGTIDCVKIYLKEIQRPLLSYEEEQELGYRLLEDDESARNILIERNLKLVVNVAKRYLGKGLSFLDLIQEGNIGLTTAVDKYDVTRGCRFSTYATWWIRQAIIRAIENQGRTIRLPVHIQEKLGKYNEVATAFEIKYGRMPSVEEIAKVLGITTQQAAYLENLRGDTVSINTLVGNEEDSELETFIASDEPTPEDYYVDQAMQKDVRDLLWKCNLKDNEIKVITLRYGLDDKGYRTLAEIGKTLKITRERVRQYEATALRKMRNSKYAKSLAIYLQYPDQGLKNIENYRNEDYTGNKKYKKVNFATLQAKNIINTELPKEDKQMAKEIKSIYEYFSEYSKEQIDAMLTKLSEEERILIAVRYGTDLTNPNPTQSLTDEQTKMFYGSLIPKMKRLLSNPDYKAKPRKKAKNASENKENSTVSIETTNLVLETEEKTKTEVIEKTSGVSKSDCLKLLEILKTPTFGELMSNLSAKEAVIIALKLGYVDEKYFSSKAIAQFLNIDEADVVETTRNFLLLYKDNITKLIDQAIEVASNDPMQKNK